jgi:spore coat protein CotH
MPMTPRFLLAAFLAAFFTLGASAQTLPSAMRISDDGRMLITGDQASTGLYDSATIRTVYLTFPQANYWTLLTQNYTSQIDIPAQMEVDGVTYDSVGVRFKGQTSYMGASASQKKSFNISTHFVHEDQKIMGYKTLNLNNAFQDPSFLREIYYQNSIRRHVPAAKSNFVQLNINGQPWGIYPNVQQLNKDFLEEWFLSNDGINWRADRPGPFVPGGPGGGGSWGDGTAALNYLGADTTLYKQYYTLKSSDLDNPWSYLVTACQMLNQTSIANLPAVLPNYLDIDRTLWFLASEIAYSDDDSYVYKGKMDYYLYYEPETGRITPLEYDGNSVMTSNAVNWSPFYNANKVNYPLLNRMLQVPEWRQRYLAHMRTIIAEQFVPAKANAIIDNYRTQIEALVQADPKKLYTYNQFISELTVLKNFVNNRRNTLLANTEVAQVAPTIQSASYSNISGQAWTPPAAGEPANVTAQVSAANGIFQVRLYHAAGLTGNFTQAVMYDDGQHNDGAAGDGIYGAAIPAYPAGSWVRFYIEAVANNTAKSVSYLPVGAEHDVFVYKVRSLSVNGPVVINEVMASNVSTVTDPAGQFDDWFELYNNSNESVDLSGYFLSDKSDNPTKFRIADGISIEANGYLIFWADENGTQGATHCNFKLSGDGEIVSLYRPDTVLMDSVHFGAQIADVSYARVPNGTGSFIQQAPTFSANNNATATEEPIAAEPQMLIFPNPTADMAYIRLENTTPNLPLTVFDLRGQLLHREITYGAELELSTQNWPAGVYVVRYGNMASRLVVRK